MIGLLKRFIGLAGANALYLLSQLAVLSALAQLSDLQTVAAFGFTMAIVQPAYMFAQFGLREALTTDVSNEHPISVYLTLRLAVTAAVLVITIGILLALNPSDGWLALPIVVSKMVELQNEFFYGAMQRSERTNFIARSLLLRGPPTAILFSAVLFLSRSAELAFWSQAAIWTSVLVGHDIRTSRKLGYPIQLSSDWRAASHLGGQCMPLGVGRFLSALQVNIPRLMVALILGTQALALFTVVTYLQRPVLSIFDSLEQVVIRRLSELWAGGLFTKFYRAIKAMAALTGSVGLVGIVFAYLLGGPLLAIVFGAEYAQAASVLVWVALAIAIRLVAMSCQSAIYAQRRFLDFGSLQAAVLIATVPLTWFGINEMGIDGAGIALAGVAAVRLLFILWLVRRRGKGAQQKAGL